MENRQYSHQFQGLEMAVYRELTPSILDVPPIRKGYDTIRKGSKFGIALNLYHFKDDEVKFSIQGKFLRVNGEHKARKFGNIPMAQKFVYYFYIPTFVVVDRIAVEWYNDNCVYISERPPKPPNTSVFGPSADEESSEEESVGDDDVPQSVEELKKRQEEEIERREDSSQTADEKESVDDEVRPEDDSSYKESLIVECGSERDLAEVSIEEESVPEDSSVQKDGSPRVDPSSEKVPEGVGSGTESLADPIQRESSSPESAECAESVEVEETPESLGSGIRRVEKLFRDTDLKATRKILKPIFVDKNYKPDIESLDIKRLIENQRIGNDTLIRNFFLD